MTSAFDRPLTAHGMITTDQTVGSANPPGPICDGPPLWQATDEHVRAVVKTTSDGFRKGSFFHQRPPSGYDIALQRGAPLVVDLCDGRRQRVAVTLSAQLI